MAYLPCAVSLDLGRHMAAEDREAELDDMVEAEIEDVLSDPALLLEALDYPELLALLSALSLNSYRLDDAGKARLWRSAREALIQAMWPAAKNRVLRRIQSDLEEAAAEAAADAAESRTYPIYHP
jgi:glutaredoxin 2